MTSLPSCVSDPAHQVTHLGQQDATSAVGEACHEKLAALEQYSAILLDDRDNRCASAEERAALVDLEARLKIPSPHRCQSFPDIHAKTVVYHQLAEWFPPHDLDVYASDLIGEFSTFLEREHLDSGLAARISRPMPPQKGAVPR